MLCFAYASLIKVCFPLEEKQFLDADEKYWLGQNKEKNKWGQEIVERDSKCEKEANCPKNPEESEILLDFNASKIICKF